MHALGNCVFVAEVARACEAALIYEHGDSSPYDNIGKRIERVQPVRLVHDSDAPRVG